jgi:signal transduction histidine kinase
VKRRITAAIVGVTALVLLLLGIPLAIAVQHDVVQSEILELQRETVRLIADLSVPLQSDALAELRASDDDMTVTVYDMNGSRLIGPGPAATDDAVRRALVGQASTDRSAMTVTSPIYSGDDVTVGALRLDATHGESTRRMWLIWSVMGGAAVVALGLAWLLARAVARRLADPIQHLAGMAAEIGNGRVVDAPASSSIAELDALGATLAASSRHVHEVVARERRFSADVSHQLRTPLTHLRLTLERATPTDDLAEVVDSSLGDVVRIEATVDHLLAFAREAVPTGGATDLVAAVGAAAARWSATATAAGRRIDNVTGEGVQPVRAAPTAIDQTLDVLIDNALRYGAGTLRVGARAVAGGAAIDISDDGSVALDDSVFERGTGNGHGIGLALARSMIEAEGGRLLLTRRAPPTFTIVLLADDTDTASSSTPPPVSRVGQLH